jgi:hypothetical protein
MDKHLSLLLGRANVPGNMLDLYSETWLPFGKLLTDMEAAGVKVERGHLAQVRGLRPACGLGPPVAPGLGLAPVAWLQPPPARSQCCSAKGVPPGAGAGP